MGGGDEGREGVVRWGEGGMSVWGVRGVSQRQAEDGRLPSVLLLLLLLMCVLWAGSYNQSCGCHEKSLNIHYTVFSGLLGYRYSIVILVRVTGIKHRLPIYFKYLIIFVYTSPRLLSSILRADSE